MKTIFATILQAMLLIGLSFNAASAQEPAQAYEFGPGDRFEMRVVIWNEELRQFENWSVFNGTYSIQLDGAALVPLIGALPAEGKTPMALSLEIATALQARVGLIEEPSVTIEISGYRPFYVVGDVGRPGQYESRPNLTVAQAHAIAGGDDISIGGRNPELEAFRDRGSLRQILGETARAEVRLARLTAEKLNANEIRFPSDISHPDGPAVLEDIKSAETAIFLSRQTSIDLEANTLDELKQLLRTEAETLEAKLAGQIQQTRLARENLANLETLVERGISRAAPLLDAQRSLFELESKELDLQNGIYRARQRINEAERDSVALQSRRTNEISRELQSVSAQLEALAIRAATIRRLIAENEEAGLAIDADDVVTVYTLTRTIGDETTIVDADLGDRIRPGDILTVDRLTLED